MGEQTSFFASPSATHLVYVPLILFVGIIIGFVFGRKVGVKEGKADFLGAGDDDDLA